MSFRTMHFIHLLFVLSLCFCITKQQRLRSCFNASIRMVKINNLMQRIELSLNENRSALDLKLHATWDVDVPQGVVLDGFIYHLQESLIGTSQSSIVASNACNFGNQSYWLNSDDPSCMKTSLGCTSTLHANSSALRICPVTVTSLGNGCRGTGNFYLEDRGYVSIPSTVRNLTFPIEFHTSYVLQVLAYYREFVNTLSNLVNINPVQDCPSLLSNQSGLSVDDATQFCCDQDIPHIVARNVTFHELEPDFNTDSVSYVIRWLPPLFSNQLSGFQLRYASIDGANINSFKVNSNDSFPLSDNQLSLLTSCDNSTVYYTATLTGLTPTLSYELMIRTVYNNDELFQCSRGNCDFEKQFSVPATNSCDENFGFCDKLARCTPVNDTEFPTLNSTCICPSGYTGNGINKTIDFQGASGCNPIDYCEKELFPCSEGATCENLSPSLMKATCSCGSGYFGDGYLDGGGCTHISVVLLAVLIPSLLLLIVLISFILRRIYMKRRCKEDFAWEMFIANDALREFSIINQLGNDENDGVWLPTFGEKWEVDRSMLQVGDIAGRGNYGIVYKGHYKFENDGGDWEEIPVAIKTVKEGANEITRIKEFLTEIGFMMNLGNHPNILKVLGCCTTQKPVFLVTDYLKYGDLLHFLWDAREPSLCLVDPVYNVTEKSLYKIAVQVADGMDYLTKARIIHGDLAARNILVGEDLLCKISDFGLANDVYRYGVIQGQSERCVPFKWISPERMMAGKVPITSKSDVWSFGNLLYEMVTLGCMPHAAVSTDDLLEKLKKGYRMKQPSTCSDEMFVIMSECWKWRPSSRPTFSNLVKSLEGAQAAVENTKYVNLVEIVCELNKSSYTEDIGEQKKKSAIVDNEVVDMKMNDLSPPQKSV